jgi:hypothetical protein
MTQALNNFILPPSQNNSTAWLGCDLAKHPEKWVTKLSSEHVAELQFALDKVLSDSLDMTSITQEDFPLPSLGQLLVKLKQELLHGLGFALIRGFETENFTKEEICTIFFGLGSYLGNARSQNAAGELLGHVKDIGVSSLDNSVRIYQTNERQTFHTDSCDVVGLLCLQQARYGGESMLVSAASIYNAFLDKRPDLLPRLFDPIGTDRRGEVPNNMKPYFEIPVFTWHLGYLNVMYQRQYIDSGQRFSGAMRLTSEHVQALDIFDELANSNDLTLTMKFEPGDIQFVHNHTILHDRKAFEDWSETERKRHLLRLWLSVPGDRPLPDCFSERFGTTTVGNRGGIDISN